MSANVWGWKAVGQAAVLAVTAATALWLAGRSAQGGDAPAKATADEKEVMPAGGVAVVSVRFADLWDNAALKSAREKLAKEAPDFLEQAQKQLGVAPDEVERITGLWPSVERPVWLVFVTTNRAYDAAKVAETLAPKGKEETVNGRKLVLGDGDLAIGFVGDRTFVRGRAEDVRGFLKGSEGAKDGSLSGVLQEAGDKHLVVAAVDVAALAKSAPPDLPPDAAPFKPLLKAKNAYLTVDLGDELKENVRVTFEGESDAKQGEEAVNAALDLARAAVVKQLEEMEKNKELAEVVGVMKDVQAALREAKVERNGSTVEVSASRKIDAEKTGVVLLKGIQKIREAASRMQSTNNLKQMALAMYNYQDTYQHFPANAIYDKAGKPLLSSRMMILPYIEEEALYKQFHLDEPWDSDNNKKLLEKMPKVFTAPTESEEALKNHETPYQGFDGKGAFFDGKEGIKVTDITDGTSQTIMIVEAAKPVPWTKPEDIPFDEGKLLPKVGGLFDHIFHVAMCDGSVRTVSTSVKEATLRAAITINGGEVRGAGLVSAPA